MRPPKDEQRVMTPTPSEHGPDVNLSSSVQRSFTNTCIPASTFTYSQLADIYNQTRVDYIVPMPMNARRLQEYVEHHAVDLAASCVAVDEERAVLGIGMLGARGERTWLTRLGVIPQRRRRHVGHSVVSWLLGQARARAASRAQLEVIDGNEPALRLFHGFGFTSRRTLLVIRRAPEAVRAPASAWRETALEPDAIARVLAAHTASTASWIDEAGSLLNAGGLHGVRVVLENGEAGEAVFRVTPIQITHIIVTIEPGASAVRVAHALLAAVHARFPEHDTKVENLPLSSPFWPAFQAIGYTEAFRRIEMTLAL
jgi:ribosomal protein S18 acetylase RimI-like enzyme